MRTLVHTLFRRKGLCDSRAFWLYSTKYVAQREKRSKFHDNDETAKITFRVPSLRQSHESCWMNHMSIVVDSVQGKRKSFSWTETSAPRKMVSSCWACFMWPTGVYWKEIMSSRTTSAIFDSQWYLSTVRWNFSKMFLRSNGSWVNQNCSWYEVATVLAISSAANSACQSLLFSSIIEKIVALPNEYMNLWIALMGRHIGPLQHIVCNSEHVSVMSRHLVLWRGSLMA